MSTQKQQKQSKLDQLRDRAQQAEQGGGAARVAQLIEFRLLLLFLGRHQLILKRDRLTTEDTEEM